MLTAMSVCVTPIEIKNLRIASGRNPLLRSAFSVGSRGSSHPSYSPRSILFLNSEVLNLPNSCIFILPQSMVIGYFQPRWSYKNRCRFSDFSRSFPLIICVIPSRWSSIADSKSRVGHATYFLPTLGCSLFKIRNATQSRKAGSSLAISVFILRTASFSS